ncbi:MAG: hypothetical protein V1899_00645 [Planctomycetota bacterium]
MAYPLRVAVVGLGHLGKFHAETYNKLAHRKNAALTLVALCDNSPAGAKSPSLSTFRFFAIIVS